MIKEFLFYNTMYLIMHLFPDWSKCRIFKDKVLSWENPYVLKGKEI